MFDSGVGTIEDWSEALERSGALISTEMASDFARFNDQLNLLGKQFQGLKVQIFGDLIGPMADFVEFLNTEEGTRIMREKLDAIGTAAQVVGGIIAVRFVAQLVTATVQMGIASVQAARLTAQLATMGTGATAASAAFSRLGFVMRGLFGPVGIAAAAIGSFMLASDEATGSVFGFESAMRDLRFEMRNFSTQQQIIDDMQAFQAEADAAKEQIELLQQGLSKLAGDRQPGERLRDYNMRMQAVAEKTKLANAEIEKLQGVASNASRRVTELRTELANFEGTTSDASDAVDELNEKLADDERQKFLRDMQDLSDELEGPAMVAARKFAREIERIQNLLQRGIVSPTEAANYFQGLAQQLKKEAAKAGDDPFNLVETIADAVSEGFSRVDAQTLLSGGFGAVMEVVGRTAFESVGASLGEKFGADLGDKAGAALGDMLGGALGEQLGATVGNALGSALGSAVPVIGQVVGSLIGELLFGQKDPKFQVGGAGGGFASTGGAVKGQFETAFGITQFRFRNIEDAVKDQVRGALIQFDNTIASFIDDPNQLRAITDALSRFGFDSQDEGASIQKTLEKRFDAILGTFDSFTQGIVRQAFGLEAQVQRLSEVLEVQRQMLFTGTMGFGDANAMLGEIAGMQRGAETLVDTFNRFTQTMDTLAQVSDLLNVNLKGGTQGIRVFADELLRVFGDDMQKFQASMSKIFDTFFDTTEVIEAAATAERTRATRLLEALGVAVTDATFTAEGFRQLFENLFPTLDAQDAAILIEAGVAVATLIDYESQLTDARRDQAGVLTQLTAEGEAFAQAMIATEESIALAPLNAFQREMVGIQRNLYRTINAINQAAGSAITQEAAERALARAHEAAAIQAAAAVARLEASTLRLVQQVFGTPLDEINRQIAELESNSNGVADAIGNAASAMEDLIAFADSLLIGNLSPLPSRERLGLGLEQLRAASAAGDVQAVQSLAQQVLQIGRERFATGPEFTELFNLVDSIMRGTTPADDTQQVTVVESPMLEALFRERDAINAEIAAADRRANATDIAQAIADISLATGKSFEEVARDLGVPLADLAKILGLDMEGLDTLLKSMMVDTDSLARTLETYAKEIRDSILQMTNAILEALGKQAQEPTAQEMFEDWVAKNPQKPGPVVVGIVDEMIPIDEPAPPPPPAGGGAPPAPYVPPQDPPDDKIPDDMMQPTSFADLLFGKDVVRNTKETTEAINRLTDAIVKSNTRSSRTALA
jgi:hypothetical protein